MENIFAFSDPQTQKALSRVSKYYRAIYMRLYFADGLRMQPLGLKCICNKKCFTCSGDVVTVLGYLTSDRIITYKYYCRSRQCRKADEETSFRMVCELLKVDNMQNRYLFVGNAIKYIRSLSKRTNSRQLLHDKIIKELLLPFDKPPVLPEHVIKSCAMNAMEHLILDRPDITKNTVFVCD